MTHTYTMQCIAIKINAMHCTDFIKIKQDKDKRETREKRDAWPLSHPPKLGIISDLFIPLYQNRAACRLALFSCPINPL